MRNGQPSYQYEPLITPTKWQGDEKRFSIRLTQLLDDLFGKYGSMANKVKSLEKAVSELPTEPEEPEVPSITIDNVYPVGSVYVSSENVNPASVFGGTWELVDKEFKPQLISGSTIFTINTTNVSSLDGAYCILSGHTISIRIAIKNKVVFEDSTLAIGTFNFAKIGLSRLSMAVYGTGASDGLNGVSYFTVNATSGVMNHADLIGSDKTTTGQAINYVFTQAIQSGHMLDSFCNKFYWKRTA